jgi:subtilisin family serine protease
MKPDVVAPGTNVISSYSSYYLEKHPEASDIKWDVAHFDFNGRTYAWNTNTGTSMSTPAVSGAIALWLQANPYLTPQDIMGVFSRTCQRVDDSLDYPNIYYGYGQIDVYKGLLDILNLTGIKDISQNQPKALEILPKGNGIVNLKFNDIPTSPFWIHVYTTSGVKVFSQKLVVDNTSVDVDMGNLPQGVYVIQVNGSNREMTGSTLVRL